MNTNKKATRIADTSQHKAAIIAGFMYLFIIITPLLSLIFIDSKIVMEGNVAATINNIMANELLFRISTAINLIIFVSVVILAIALYVTLKPVNKNLSLLALSWRLGEAIFGSVAVLSSLIILLLLNGKNYLTVFGTEQFQAIVGLFLDIYWSCTIIIFVFLALGSIVFFYLFLKSKYIPKILAIWGIFSFLLVLIGALVSLIFSNNAFMIFGAQAILFEIVIGFWLLFKGVKIPEMKS